MLTDYSPGSCHPVLRYLDNICYDYLTIFTSVSMINLVKFLKTMYLALYFMNIWRWVIKNCCKKFIILLLTHFISILGVTGPSEETANLKSKQSTLKDNLRERQLQKVGRRCRGEKFDWIYIDKKEWKRTIPRKALNHFRCQMFLRAFKNIFCHFPRLRFRVSWGKNRTWQLFAFCQ